VVYGLFKNDAVIMLANGVTLALLGIILYQHVRSAAAGGRGAPGSMSALMIFS
jgi:hypothetical protein